ncbi:DUF3226 domain-containing protein [Tepidibacter mesophilus]|uniref:DUF3226 domain-containing protein n=1 Tax=Tepidibacter mesophilus TaxID=655607 RepID=UPI000C06CB66|nr:DUF3226 domain-containing protein [Tepidibacter mesophilus]
MRSILLCEGKTDAIILSYYLGKVKGWNYHRDNKKKLNIPVRNKDTEEVNWYKLNDDLLSIWAVGGKDNFDYAISKIIDINKIANEEDVFNKIIILRDRDNFENDEDISNDLDKSFSDKECFLNLKNNEWIDGIYKNEFDDEMSVKCLTLIIPFDKKGALETFLLDAISELGDEEKVLINRCKSFINDFNLTKYLNTERLRVKGELSTTLAVMYPDKVFTTIDNMLRNISWEKYKSVQESFKKLEEI